ncbi:uncharacterized protein LOC133883552 [Phragmites australis]|uniref:uncharacterized protein LOC133883552 n=1 Tax=Phragmites australis TaxID=29695 RepID=UPI002D76DD97|nr:uncharacterized protein LOC133883552 [Phragmites australis]
MDRPLRSPARRSAAPRAEERLRSSPHRFLRPGALARLRDSKVLARSLRSAAASRMLPPSSSPARPPPPAFVAGDGGSGVPCFLGAARGMRYPLRKKLAAARSVVFLPPQTDTAELFVDSFASAPSDLVAAH